MTAEFDCPLPISSRNKIKDYEVNSMISIETPKITPDIKSEISMFIARDVGDVWRAYFAWFLQQLSVRWIAALSQTAKRTHPKHVNVDIDNMHLTGSLVSTHSKTRASHVHFANFQAQFRNLLYFVVPHVFRCVSTSCSNCFWVRKITFPRNMKSKKRISNFEDAVGFFMRLLLIVSAKNRQFAYFVSVEP